MKMPFPDWHMAKLALEGYAEDGVSGTLGYDDETGQWYVDLDDTELEGYMANLRKCNSEVIRGFSDLFRGGAKNVQGQAQVPPEDNENRLALYLLDSDCRTARGFKVIATLTEVFNRKSAFMFFGSTCEKCGRRMVAILAWENVKPKKEVNNG